jgi:hypothetical protein
MKLTIRMQVLVFFFLFISNFTFAQNGMVVTQNMMTLESDAVYSLIADKELQEMEDIAAYLFEISNADLKNVYKSQGSEGEVRKMVMYLQDRKFRMDMDAPPGKMSMILREDLDKMYNLMWPQKKYMEMSLRQIREMRKGVAQNMSSMQNMPDVSKMLENLPPEAREKALEAMKQAGQMQKMYTQQPQPEQQSAEKTGRKKTINGFPCEEWRVRRADEISTHWVTASKPELAKKFKDFSETMSAGFGMDKKKKHDEKEIWELVPGTIPIESRNLRQLRMGKFELEVMLVEKIEQKNLEGKTFEVPEGFEPGSMFDMMNMQRDKKKWD